MGQKLPLCGQLLGAARSRQDESKEVGDAGSKRTSSRGKEGHHVWWSGLIFRLLPISRLCRSLILKRRERRHIARRCSVHKSAMGEPSNDRHIRGVTTAGN
jgi:hypothetical protein